MESYTVSKTPDAWIFEVVGEFNVKDVLEIIRKYYSEITNEHIIWNLTRATVDGITIDDFRLIADTAGRALRHSKSTRSAFVALDKTMHHLMCIYTAIGAMSGITMERSVFRTVDEALAWCRKPAEN